MPNRDGGRYEFYPAFCFHLSPTYNDWVRLSATDLHALKARPGFEGQDVYFHLNHPIRYVRLVGIIVAFDAFPTRFVFVIDDFSGTTIDVTCEKPKAAVGASENATAGTEPISIHAPSFGQTMSGKEVSLEGIDIGTVVKVKGSIIEWRDQRQVSLERIWRVASTNDEASSWTENSDFYIEVLAKPWHLADNDVERARKRVAGHSLKRRSARHKKRLSTGTIRSTHKQALVNVATGDQESCEQGNDELRRQKQIRDSDRAERERAYEAKLRGRVKPALESRAGEPSQGMIPTIDSTKSAQPFSTVRVSAQGSFCEPEKVDETHRIKMEETQRAREADRRERERIYASSRV